jgi:hypothetical protein
MMVPVLLANAGRATNDKIALAGLAMKRQRSI